jgi:hypothetical protein
MCCCLQLGDAWERYCVVIVCCTACGGLELSSDPGAEPGATALPLEVRRGGPARLADALRSSTGPPLPGGGLAHLGASRMSAQRHPDLALAMANRVRGTTSVHRSIVGTSCDVMHGEASAVKSEGQWWPQPGCLGLPAGTWSASPTHSRESSPRIELRWWCWPGGPSCPACLIGTLGSCGRSPTVGGFCGTAVCALCDRVFLFACGS